MSQEARYRGVKQDTTQHSKRAIKSRKEARDEILRRKEEQAIEDDFDYLEPED